MNNFEESRKKAIKLITKAIERENNQIKIISNLSPLKLYKFELKDIFSGSYLQHLNCHLSLVGKVIGFGKLHLKVNPIALTTHLHDKEADLKYYTDKTRINMNHLISVEEFPVEDIPLLVNWVKAAYFEKFMKGLK